MRDIAYFIKTLHGLGIGQAAAVTADLGFDCADLLIREGFTVSPQRLKSIAEAVQAFALEGVRVPMATIDAVRADDSAQTLLGHCRDAGIGIVRLGFWRYRPDTPWRVQADTARHELEVFERLGARLGLKLIVQLHGGTVHASGAQTAWLLADRDPAYIGVYPDPGNQAVQEGSELWPATYDMLAPWIACIGVKNGAWSAGPFRPSGQREWRAEWCALDEGTVPWDDIVSHLVSERYAGLFSMHSHYRVPRSQALAKARADLVHFRGLIAAAEGVSDA